MRSLSKASMPAEPAVGRNLVPTFFAFCFALVGFVLGAAVLSSAGDEFLSSAVESIFYLLYEPSVFLLVGTLLGCLVEGLFLLASLVFKPLRWDRDSGVPWRAGASAFVIVTIVGGFLSNNGLIQGGYYFSIQGNVITLVVAGLAFLAAFRLSTSLQRLASRRWLAVHVGLAGFALLWFGFVRFYWVEAVQLLPPVATHATEPKARPVASDGSIRNVIIILVDTLRADHMSLYGYRRETSPRIDRWAGEPGSVVFDRAFTPKTKTSPAVASLFTGLYPPSHGIFYCAQWLPDNRVTLAEILQESGFRTCSIVANANVGPGFNFDQGFENCQHNFSGEKARAEELVNQSIAWLNELESDERFFLYLHLIDPHGRYDPIPPYRDLFLADEWSEEQVGHKVTMGTSHLEHIRDDVAIAGHGTNLDYYVSMYDAEIAYADAEIGRFLDYLKGKGLSEDTLVLFTSDHGESLTEHNYFFNHGSFVYQPTAHVPLLLHHPSLGGARRSEELVSLTDIAPTILNLLGIEPSPAPRYEGAGLPLEPKADSPRTYAFVMGGDRHEAAVLRSIVDERWKFIHNSLGLSSSGIYSIFNTFYPRFKTEWVRRRPEFRAALLEYQLYDLEKDPEETNNVFLTEIDEAIRLRTVMENRYEFARFNPNAQDLPMSAMDTGVMENLRALGYL